MKITYTQNKYLAPPPFAAPWLRRLVLAWLFAAAAEYLLLAPGLRNLASLDGIAQMSLPRMAAVAGGLFLLCALLSRFLPDTAERWAIAGLILVHCAASLISSFTLPLLAVCIPACGAAVLYALCGWNGNGFRRGLRTPEQKRYLWAAGLLAGIFFLLVSAWTVARVYSFSTPTYDFGIFAQMFHSMRTTGLPITTVERDGALSHFAVHVSPIYYLLLPFYMLIPQPALLQVLQAAVLASAVIPLWKLGRHHGLTPLTRLLLCAVLLVYPAYAGGTGYDIHENAFLTPLILWLLYSIDRKNNLLTAISALLTLMVKEDAAVYVAIIGLYLILRSLLTRNPLRGCVTGAALLAVSVGWFLGVTGYLASSGDGVMTYRYNNFIYDGSGSLLSVIKAVLLCPMKAVYECVDAEKLEFIALTLIPLGFLPLFTRRYERYVLLIPYLLINLMSDYRYQHDIFFQYTYGSTACLVYLTLVNLADLHLEWRRVASLVVALVIGGGCFFAQIMPKVTRYTGYIADYGSYYDSLRNVLDTIPEGEPAAATTFYTTYLSQRDILYDVRYASVEHMLSCDYVAVGVTDTSSLKKFASDDKSGYEGLIDLLTREGYVKIAEHTGKLEIYQRK